MITDSTPKKVSVMIVANKIDLRDQMRAEGKRVIEHAEGVKLAKVRCFRKEINSSLWKVFLFAGT